MIGFVISVFVALGLISAVLMGAVKLLEALASGIGHAWRTFDSQEKARRHNTQVFSRPFPRGSHGEWDD